MSAIAGIQSFHTLPEETPDILSRMARELASIAPDGSDVVCQEGAGMAYAAFHITSESRRSLQPHVEDDLLVAWDGRLDNRGELERLIAVPGAAHLTDVQLFVHVYRQLGSDAFARLVGDFAVAVWDGLLERLILARDAMGGRPLFYRMDGEHLIWASTLDALVAAQTFDPEINESWLGAYLLRQAPPTYTPYRDVWVVPAGHLLVAERRGLRKVRFWSPGRAAEIRYREDREYEEHFRELLFDAVRGRLRTGGAPVCAELSGGLDSSSVACVADHLLRTESVEASELVTYSIVFDRASTSDERSFIRPVEKRLGRRGIHVLEDEYPMLASGFENPWCEVPLFLQTLRCPQAGAGERLRASQTRMVMTGLGGDQLFWSETEIPYYLADWTARGRLMAVARELARWRRRPSQVGYDQPLPQLLLRGVLRPLLASLRGYSTELASSSSRPYLGERMKPLQRELRKINVKPQRFERPSRLATFEELDFMVGHITWFYHFSQLGIQMSHPFLHRPLVEFCLGVPNEQFVRPHENRSLQRRALRDLLPPEVLHRTTKNGPDEAILRGIRREWSTIEKLLTDSRVCARGFADPDRLYRAMERASGGFAPNNLDLLRLLEVEIWLRGKEA